MREIKHALASEPKRVNAGKLILKFLATLAPSLKSRVSQAMKLSKCSGNMVCRSDPPRFYGTIGMLDFAIPL